MVEKTIIDAYPLKWPIGWKRTIKREHAIFKTTFGKARDNLLREIYLLGGKTPIISSNLALNRAGLPYANSREPEDPGICVYFDFKGKQQCIPCDRWNKVVDNLQAINLTIGALRGLDRWGSGQIMNAAFTGFVALPAPTETVNEPIDYFQGCYTKDDLKTRWRELAFKLHPDKGGNSEEFAEMNKQFNKLLNEVRV